MADPPGAQSASLNLGEVMAKARLAVPAITSAPVDAIKSCERAADGSWAVTIEVIDSPARLGDNDLLSAYELVLDAEGELASFQRIGRYHREDGMGAS